MSFASFFGRHRTARTAQHRLQVLLMHERSEGGMADLIPILRDDIIAAIGKHMSVDTDRVELSFERGDVVSLLEIYIEIPRLMQLMVVRRTAAFQLGETYLR